MENNEAKGSYKSMNQIKSRYTTKKLHILFIFNS